MESSLETISTLNSTFNYNISSASASPSPTSSPPPTAPQPAVVISPCAACKILRRRCVDKCVLAPYFPPTEPLKFTTAHRVFGASNIIKFLQELPENQRADAVSSMVYEANARIRDPVYGSAGVICHLQKQVNDLQTELARAKAELVNMESQHANLLAAICVQMANNQQQHCQQLQLTPPVNNVCEVGPNWMMNCETDQSFFIDDTLWEEPLWI